jgi:divalent metal cation (Fe/Co/Zn/Cd) transporter
MPTTLSKQALRLSYFSVGYNILEGALSLLAGSLAGSIALVGFGLDSVVESLSGGVIIWRFARRQEMSPAEEARRERRAVKLVGATFFILAAYILYEALHKLLSREIPAPSLLGIGVACASLMVMPVLFLLKYRLGQSMGSASLMADSKQTLACAVLSAALLVGLLLNYFYGFWQADPVIGLVIAGLLAREGYQALKEERLCSCAACGCSAPSPAAPAPPEDAPPDF